MSQKENVIIKIIKKKVQRLVELEKKYWKTIDDHRLKMSVFQDDYSKYYDDEFPENQSTLIYGCIDGAVIIRHTAWSTPQTVNYQIVNKRISVFHKKVPIPIDDNRLIELGVIGIGGSLKLRQSKINEFYFDYMTVMVLEYSDEEKIIEWEDAIADIKLTLLGLHSQVQQQKTTESSNNEKKKNILNEIESLLLDFKLLLGKAKNEEEIQIFLNSHPILIQPFSNIFPKQKLGEDFITDFVFASILDQGIKYTFVELEKATMPIITKKGEFTSEFKHAEKQTLDWEIWLDKHKSYLESKLPKLESPNYLIIAGRSINLNEENKTLIRAWNRRQKNTEFITYDDLIKKTSELIESLKNEETTHNK